jgi:predicted transcriptional regulator
MPTDKQLKIIKLHEKGLNNAEVGRQLDVSRAYVSQTIKELRGWDARILPLSSSAHERLLEIAKKRRVSPAKQARDMLEVVLKHRGP